MMTLETKPKLSPYWQRLADRAERTLTGQINDLEARTVDPEYCLSSDDYRQMAMRKLDLEGMKSIRESIREGGLGGKLWALYYGYGP